MSINYCHDHRRDGPVTVLPAACVHLSDMTDGKRQTGP
nr:MAG TPA: hypothetical protein [Caudoviricetes sp.]